MTYEEILKKVVFRLKAERELTRKGHPTKVTFNNSSFTKVRIREVCKVLLKLQDDDNAIKILDAFQPSDTLTDDEIPYNEGLNDYEYVDVIIIELSEEFDTWYNNYLLTQKSQPENLEWINVLKVLDVCNDIDQQLQIKQSNKISIPSFPYPYIGRFVELFPTDNIGTRKTYQQHRAEATEYLHRQAIISNIKAPDDYDLGYGNVTFDVNISKFDNFYKIIKNEYENRLKLFNKEKIKSHVEVSNRQTDKESKVKASYDKTSGNLYITDKTIKLTKDKFRSKMIEIILKDLKSMRLAVIQCLK